jgi:crossover junction endodeoxyribonuclease RuvC
VGVVPVRFTASATVRILGIDPGSQRTGYGVIESNRASSKPVVHGCIAVAGGALSDRLRRIFEGVQALIDRYQPDEVAIERVFVNRNVDSALKLGHARGAALCAVPAATPVFEYTPRAVKLAVVGFGAAEKVQVAHMIRTLLTVEGKLSADASDALAVAVCHAHSRRVHALTGASGVKVAMGGAVLGRAR